MSLPRHPLPLTLILVTGLSGLAACGLPSTARPSLQPVPARYSSSGEAAAPDRFWLEFNDAALDTLVDQALTNNPGLLAKWSRFAQANAVLRRDNAGRLPTISASGSLGASERATSSGEASSSTSSGLGLSASYEVDLWGALAAARDATALETEASAADLRAAAITLSAEVASTWFDLVVARQNAALLAAQHDDAVATARLIALRFEAGTVAETDLLRQNLQVESIAGDLELSSAQRRVLETRLGLLIGLPPGAVLPDSSQLPSLPPMPSTGVPAETLARRPDVRRSFLAIEVADKNVSVALASQRPSLKLSASASVTGTLTEFLVNFATSLGAGLAGPIFDGGARQADVDRAREAVIEKVHLYREIILAALAETEDALVREEKQLAYLESLDDQLDLATRVSARTQASYAVGMADNLELIAAAESTRSLERRILAAERDLLEYRLALYRSLAGGWEMARPDTTSSL